MASKSDSIAKAPVLIAGGLVEQFAAVDRIVISRGRGLVFSEGVEVCRAPRLALVRDRCEILLIPCDRRWKYIAIGGSGATLRAVKMRAERMYQGVGKLWSPSHHTRTQARAVAQLEMKQPGYRCSICQEPLVRREANDRRGQAHCVAVRQVRQTDACPPIATR